MTKRIKLNEYYRDYMVNVVKGKMPGEHHFVGCYLLPLLIAHNWKYPDFLNPDGSKNKNSKLWGDLIWNSDSGNTEGQQIEVKVKYRGGFVFSNFTKSQIDKVAIQSGEQKGAYLLVSSDGVLICSPKEVYTCHKDRKRSKVRLKNGPKYYSIDFGLLDRLEDRIIKFGDMKEDDELERDLLRSLQLLLGRKVIAI